MRSLIIASVFCFACGGTEPTPVPTPSEKPPVVAKADYSPKCGDDICDEDFENAATCIYDCPAYCGDNICSAGETILNCLRDCMPEERQEGQELQRPDHEVIDPLPEVRF